MTYLSDGGSRSESGFMDHTQEDLTLRSRLLIWRARLSLPGLLTRYDEKKVVSVVSALNGGLAIMTISLIAWLLDLPLIFPALGPSAFILFSDPMSHAGAPRSVILGHLVCLSTGTCVWHFICFLFGAPVTVQVGGWPLICSATLALVLSFLFLVMLSCKHPPACASSLVVAIGAVVQWQNIVIMALVVIWLTFQAVVMNRLAGLRVPFWSPRNLNLI
ncbi:MAG: HPP family protein [Sedimentisphaerales bacterium]|nr:HPP family protein [Sedimentisphaerales bacterium]